jgi:hypothetical protein
MGTQRDLRGYARSEIYSPDLIRALQAIFDHTWQEISATRSSPETADARRNDLAQMIILAHKSGLQPDEIKQALLGRSRRDGTRS